VGAIRSVPWGECLLEERDDPAVERQIRLTTGARVTGAMRYFVAAPWVAESMITLNARIMTRVHLDHDLADLAGLVVSQDNSCRYCYAVQRTLLRVLGFSEDRIVRLEQDLALGGLSTSELAAIEFARRISRASPLTVPADAEPLRRAGFDDAAIRELASHAALHVLFNRTATLAALPPETFEELPDRWWARWFRPLLAPVARLARHRGKPERLADELRAGAHSSTVVALDGLPIARELRGILDAMIASPILTLRCKALMFAVVARSLGCSRVMDEAIRLATSDGASEDRVRNIVDHLSAPELTTEETLLIPFARETVWYEAPRLQERARVVAASLTPEQFVEATFVLSLANAICRLDAALLGP
jgi:AhpD family alkylhydroperoxidase